MVGRPVDRSVCHNFHFESSKNYDLLFEMPRPRSFPNFAYSFTSSLGPSHMIHDSAAWVASESKFYLVYYLFTQFISYFVHLANVTLSITLMFLCPLRECDFVHHAKCYFVHYANVILSITLLYKSDFIYLILSVCLSSCGLPLSLILSRVIGK